MTVLPIKDPQKCAEYKARWYQQNRERMQAACAARYETKRDEILAKCRQYREQNIDKLREYDHSRSGLPHRIAQGKAYYHANRETLIAKSTAYKRSRPDVVATIKRNSRLKRYGLNLEQYELLAQRSKGHCELCGCKFNGTPHIDHNHVTQHVRGLLCGSCNRALGLFKDRADVMRRAAEWVERD